MQFMLHLLISLFRYMELDLVQTVKSGPNEKKV